MFMTGVLCTVCGAQVYFTVTTYFLQKLYTWIIILTRMKIINSNSISEMSIQISMKIWNSNIHTYLHR